MAEFDLAVEKTLALEGWGKLVNDRFDSGGLTRWGISQKSYPEENIDQLTREHALELYRRDFWHPLYDQIADQEIANELFDFGVNTSARGWPKLAVRILQEAVRYLVVGPVVIDGMFGPKMLEAVNSLIPDRLLREFRTGEAYYYADIVIRQPDVNEGEKKRFLKGWLRRVMA
jgi:lysozyme family protein